ncbi:MAG: glycosyltransferase family 4 protein [Variovorax sp.]
MPPKYRSGLIADKCLRIVLILTEFPPRIGGMQTHALALANSLCALGHQITVITYRKSTRIEMLAADALDAELDYRIHRELGRISHAQNLRICARIIDEFQPNLAYASTILYGELSQRCNVAMTARSVGNDVLRPWIVYPFEFASRLVGRTFFEDHAYRLFRRLDYPEFLEAIWRRARVDRMERAALQHVCIFANSKFTANLLAGIGLVDTQIQQLVGGVDVERFANSRPTSIREDFKIPSDAFVVMTVCRLVRKKAVDFLVGAWPAICERIPKAHLVVVGAGQREQHLRALAAQSSVSEHITFTGSISQDHVETFYWAADVFVLASREWVEPTTGLRDVETMGRVLCEANAAGLPVVASRSGGIPSVVENGVNGLLFEPEDAVGLADCLDRIRLDANLREELVQNGRAIASEKFAFSKIVDAHVSAFVQIIERTDASRRSSSNDSTVPPELCVVPDVQE